MNLLFRIVLIVTNYDDRQNSQFVTDTYRLNKCHLGDYSLFFLYLSLKITKILFEYLTIAVSFRCVIVVVSAFLRI